MIPYSLTTNDARLLSSLATADLWFAFLRDSFDVLMRDGEREPRMMSVGLHNRIIGHPGRFAGLLRFLDHVQKTDGVWITGRVDIAKHWAATHPPS